MRAASYHLACLLAATHVADATELRLDSVIARTERGEVELVLDSKTVFTLDAEAGTLASTGAWAAQLALGPSRLIRYSHKVEGLTASADGELTVRSYECVEGTLGATVGLNFCGSYQFGGNALDDGGYGDDVRIGEPISLQNYHVSRFDWNGERLVLIVGPDDPAQPDGQPEKGLELTFLPAGRSDGNGAKQQ